MIEVSASGRVSEHSGLGVMQAELYSRLPRLGAHLHISQDREADNSSRNIGGLLAALRTPAAHDVHLALVPPSPLRVRAPMVSVVLDLRWQRTRRTGGRLYRYADVRWAVRRSAIVTCISTRTANDLTALIPSSEAKLRVIELGPGQVSEPTFRARQPGSVVMLGAAAHKRNEFAAEAMCLARPAWVTAVTCIGVSSTVEQTFRAHWPELPVRALSRLSSAELVAELARADVLVNLGLDEGFGLPYIEALASGCQVIAADQTLTRDLLGSAAVLIPARDVTGTAQALQRIERTSETARRELLARYSWDKCARQYFGVLCEAASLPRNAA